MAALVAASVVWFLPAAGIEVLEPYQTARLTGFTNPDSDPAGATYNVTQSITAVGAGGLDGRGVEGATQTRLDYLPEHHTDFVFAALAEQRGFFGAALLLGSTCSSSGAACASSRSHVDAFGAIVAGGIVIAFLFQVFVNVGMTMGIAPVTGIPCRSSPSAARRWSRTSLAIGVLQAIHARGHTGGGARADGEELSPLPSGACSRSCASPPRTRAAARQRDAGGTAREGALARARARRPSSGASRGRGRPRPRARGRTERGRRARAARGEAGGRAGRRGADRTEAFDVPTCSQRTSSMCRPGEGFPVEQIAAAVAARLGEAGTGLAAGCRCCGSPSGG